MRIAELIANSLAACLGYGRKTKPHVTAGGVVIDDPRGFKSPYSIAMQNEDFEQAESIARKLVDNAPHDSASWLCLTYPLLLTAQYDAAIESCEKALAIDPYDKQLLYTRGFIAQEQGYASLDDEAYDRADEHFQAAIRYYTRATNLDSEFTDAHYGLAAAHEGLGNSALVIKHAELFLELEPNSPKREDALDMLRGATECIADRNETQPTDEPEPKSPD